MRQFLPALLLATLLAGCFGSSPQSGDPIITDTSQGIWLDPVEGEIPAVNMVLLHDGRVLYWSGLEGAGEGLQQISLFENSAHAGESRIYDPKTGKISKPAAIADFDLLCSGQTILPDGRVLTAGGSDWAPGGMPELTLASSRGARVFDPATNEWSLIDDMLLGRWYPSLFTSAAGHAVAASGIGDIANLNEHWTQWEEYRGEWHLVNGTDQTLPLHPRVAVLPGGPLKGQVAYNTVGTMWGPFGEHPDEATWSLQRSHDGRQWNEYGPSSFGARQYANSVMLPLQSQFEYGAKFLTFGGTLQRSVVAVPFAELNDWSAASPSNQAVSSMQNPRWHANGVLLPDSTVMAIGGGLINHVMAYGQQNIPVMQPERYNPITDVWQAMANMSVPRMYHSTAILMPDGSVLTGGHVPVPMDPGRQLLSNDQIAETRLEAFQPPYMFEERPIIRSAPKIATYNTTMEVFVQSDQTISHFMLARPGATTHAFDSNQRMVQLEATSKGDYYTVQLPPDGAVTAPGYHMLFAVALGDQMRVPSEAVWVQLT